ncbi:hypothetical protein RCF98_05145 [Thiothrix lacustris]|uniref:Uncharacterized protein n=1 Tax=Thiothrix lacustris TaxID=525917 RepID=A0ABY9MT95_9GAMM|nr:hypothetical protein [Thiothrix lacustris]WML91723.1 hypothetical protein RCF98_05145 [Thiothrix lacustris]
MSHYNAVIIETYYSSRTSSSGCIRAKPIAGQNVDTSMNVECSLKMRQSHPVGTKFLINAKIKNKEGGYDFLYSYYNAPYKLINEKEAEDFLKNIKH